MRGRPLNWFSIDRRWSKRSFLIVPATYSPTGVPSAGASQGGTLAFGLVSAVVNFGWWAAEKLARSIAQARKSEFIGRWLFGGAGKLRRREIVSRRPPL